MSIFKKIPLPSQFLNLLPNRFEIAFRAVCYVSLLLIDLKFTIQLDLSIIFSILYNFSTKIVGGDNVTYLVTKIPVSLLTQKCEKNSIANS